ncbi:hypothetical protein PRUPE_2G286300 [Prunus persica]|uniref:Uncharacterized protein n=1 Tax=Prunus persica TaxID=3760 RepID=A0A251QMZ0_PRUPE|nr:hypothetical protein PRUPE_2G286300 [Prunus persica]
MPFQMSSVLRLRLRWISHILTGPPPWIYDLSSNQPLVSNPMCICEIVKKFSSISGKVFLCVRVNCDCFVINTLQSVKKNI